MDLGTLCALTLASRPKADLNKKLLGDRIPLTKEPVLVFVNLPRRNLQSPLKDVTHMGAHTIACEITLKAIVSYGSAATIRY